MWNARRAVPSAGKWIQNVAFGGCVEEWVLRVRTHYLGFGFR